MAGTLKRVLLQDLRDVEGYLEKTEETRENGLSGYLCQYQAEPDDDEFDFDGKLYDLCPECFKSIFSYMKNSAITSD